MMLSLYKREDSVLLCIGKSGDAVDTQKKQPFSDRLSICMRLFIKTLLA